MKSILFAGAVLFYFFSSIALAQVTQIQLGQHHNARSGEVVIVTMGNVSSTVTCGSGGNTAPERQLFQYTQFGAFEQGTLSLYPIQALQMQCNRYASLQEPKQAIAMAVLAAREQCFRFYRNCAQPFREDEQYFFNFVGHGRLGCEVTAFIVGTQPR